MRLLSRRHSQSLTLCGLCLLLLLLVYPALDAAALNASLQLISLNASGSGSGDRDSSSPVMTPDGRYIVFVSNADDLVPNDTNEASDVFVRDRQTGITTLVSINSNGTASGNGESKAPSISDDGRYVAFISQANDLVAIDPSHVDDVYVRDMALGTTQLVSLNYAGTISGNNDSFMARISANGRAVVFASHAQDIFLGDVNGTQTDIFERDLQAGVTRLVSVNSSGTATGNDGSNMESIGTLSADGRYVVFNSSASNLVTNDTNTVYDVFVRDVVAGTTRLVSVNSSGTTSGNSGSFGGFITPDGRYVSFASLASNLVVNDGNNLRQDAFVRDLVSGTTQLVSRNLAGTAGGNGDSGAGLMTPDGRYVVFASRATNLTSTGSNGFSDIYQRDMQTGLTRLISFDSAGTSSGTNHSSAAAVSDDGRYVAFISTATNLTPNDLNGIAPDVFVRDVQAGTTKLMSQNITGTGSGNGAASYSTSLSADGRALAFSNSSSDLTLNDNNSSFNDVFVADTQTSPAPDQLQFSASTFSINESGGTATITVNRVGSTAGTVSTTYTSIGGTATPGSDYTAVNGTLVFGPGETTKSFTVPVLEDAVNEATESVYFSLSGSSSNAVLRISDNDAVPSLTVNDVTVTEGNGGITYASFTVTRSPASEQTSIVLPSITPGTARPWEDYLPITGRLYFAPGQTTATVNVPIIGEEAFEPDEDFTLFLSNPVNASIADDRGTGVILNDDANVGISIEDATVTEGDDGTLNMGFAVRLSAASFQQVSYHYSIVTGGTATPQVDYMGVFGTNSFFPGTTLNGFSVPIQGDLLDEPDETIFVIIENPSNGAVITRSMAVGTIRDNDPEPSISINDVRVSEPRAGTSTAVFTARLSAPSGRPVTVQYSMGSGTASAGLDYQPLSALMTFNPGQTSQSVAVNINADALQEPDENFYLQLSNPVNASLARAEGVCTITDYHNRAGADFDGDAHSDVSVFRPSGGAWYITQSANNTFRGEAFGLSTDRLTPGDYDGDGKTDIAVWRPSNGYWYILRSSDNSLRAELFGQAGDLPAPGDYDGDGTADLSVYRPSNNHFYQLYSSDGSFHFVQWGVTGDLPVTGDYDGDGTTDIAIQRPSLNTFYILRSSDGTFIGQQFGQSGDKPIAGDFDGDGKTDIAVFRPSTGGWYMLNSSDNSFRGIAWGTNGDIAAAGDYDGDGKTDVAVFRPAAGTFYILQSTDNSLRAEQFGTNGDIPVLSAYIP